MMSNIKAMRASAFKSDVHFNFQMHNKAAKRLDHFLCAIRV